MRRLTERVRDGINGVCGIVETILECGGEGWALECVADNGDPCRRPDCETCVAFEDISRACSYLRHLAAKRSKA